ncbi:MAG: chromosomal replication initiator protein DnaA [Gemmatimonadetes bacterium]|nr:chromosomal replication initiator protein DnaA [Gemmatimonadota bacterium]
MELTAAEVWSRILDEARAAVPEQAFRTWLAPTEAIAFSQDTLIVSTPNPFAADWVEDKYAELLTAIGERLIGRRFHLSVKPEMNGQGVRPAFGEGAHRNGSPAEPTAPFAPPATRAHAAVPTGPYIGSSGASPSGLTYNSPLNDRYTFDRFVVGNNSQLAAATAHAVAEAPARMYNPFFIYGGVGLGKTHLMHAIGHVVLSRDPGKRVIYVSSEQFTNELVSAIQEGTMAEFRRLYRQIDLLLVDDIQFLEGKERTQEEFFHTFNALHDGRRQIVLTSDRPPKEIGLEDRLISRFEWGMVADIKPPDFETRVAILRKRVEEDGLEISGMEEVLQYIARNCTSSVREIEGAVIKLLAFASLTRREITIELAREVLGGVLQAGDGSGVARATPDLVRRKVAEAWGVSAEGLQSKKRTKDLTVPRQVAMYLIKDLFDTPLVEIGRLFGGRDHSTVIHSISKVEEDMANDVAFRERVDTLRKAMV